MGWLQIESSLIAPFHLKEIVWELPRNRPKQLLTNPYVSLTLILWDRLRNTLSSSPSVVSSFLGQSWFPPAASPSSFRIWRSLGISRFCDVATLVGLLSKEALEQKYDASLPWFQYYQIRDLYYSHYWNHKPDNMTGFKTLLSKPQIVDRGAISIIYRNLQQENCDAPAAFQRAWDKFCQPGDTTKQ